AASGRRRAEGARAMARIVVAGSGSVGACIAYHLALLGARDVVLADCAEIASGSTGKAMGGVRQQFSSAAEVRLAQESISFFEKRSEERRVGKERNAWCGQSRKDKKQISSTIQT